MVCFSRTLVAVRTAGGPTEEPCKCLAPNTAVTVPPWAKILNEVVKAGAAVKIFFSTPRERGVEASGMCVDRGQEMQESPGTSQPSRRGIPWAVSAKEFLILDRELIASSDAHDTVVREKDH